MEWHDPAAIIGSAIPVGMALFGFTFGIGKYFFYRNVKALDEKLSDIATIFDRLAGLEQCLAAKPQCQMHAENTLTIKALHKRMDQQHQAMDELIKVVGRIDGRQEGLGRAVDLMNQFLIEQGGNKR